MRNIERAAAIAWAQMQIVHLPVPDHGFVTKLGGYNADNGLTPTSTLPQGFHTMSQQALERPLSGASAEAICYHYDVGTEFYRLWLDHNLTYSAARWDDPCRIAGGPVSLELAQDAKLDFHLKALGIGRGDTLLDIGGGWGSMLRRAVEQYGIAAATGLTLSADQHNYLRALDLPATARNSSALCRDAARARRGNGKPPRAPGCGCGRDRQPRPNFLFGVCSLATGRQRKPC